MSDLARAGAALMRAVDEFWGERWDPVADARVEIRARAPEDREWLLDEVHEYDAAGSLILSVFFDEGRPWLLRENEYGLPDCLARRTSRDLEEGTWTSWSYVEGRREGRPACLVEPRSLLAGRAQDREIYLLDEEGRVETRGIKTEPRLAPAGGARARDSGAGMAGAELWRARRDARGRIVELRVEDARGRPSLSWRYELDARGLPARELRIGVGGAAEEERRFEREYDEEGFPFRERLYLADLALGPLFASPLLLRERRRSARTAPRSAG